MASVTVGTVREEAAMDDRDGSFDRRSFLGASALTLVGLSSDAFAQQTSVQPPRVTMSEGEAKTISQAVADYIVGFDLKSVPPAVIDRARIAFIDTLGVMLAGSHEEVAHIVLEMVKAEASAPQATVVGSSLRASPQLAALANGVASHAMDYDLTYVSGQAIAAVIPAILPLAEVAGTTPAEAVAAYVIGAEVGGRLARSNFRASSVGGWHTVGTVGAVAAAAAAARLLKVPAAAIPDVLGISASLASGFSANFGTMTKPLHCGHAARNGVAAALLGKEGFTANSRALEAPSGYFSAFGRGLDVSLEPFKDLGSRYDLVSSRFALKAYPCGGLTHTSIEAALALRSKVGARLSDIKEIHCFVTRNAGQRAGTQYPATVEAAKFSVAYLVPYALIHGAPRIAAFTEKALADERIKALARIVTASVDPELGPGTDGSPARIRVTLANGEVLEQRNDHASGSEPNPMTPAQIEAKFNDCAAQVMSAETGRKVYAFLDTLPAQRSLDPLWPLLRKA
jgi:2-methylcitrate dehydratase PrpD